MISPFDVTTRLPPVVAKGPSARAPYPGGVRHDENLSGRDRAVLARVDRVATRRGGDWHAIGGRRPARPGCSFANLYDRLVASDDIDAVIRVQCAAMETDWAINSRLPTVPSIPAPGVPLTPAGPLMLMSPEVAE